MNVCCDGRSVVGHLLAMLLVLGVRCDGLQVLAGDSATATPERDPSGIQHIDLVHLSHTDCGYTDNRAVTRELQRRYLDVAIDGILATLGKPPSARFCWTAEATLTVDDWWRSATAERRKDLLKAVDSGQLDVAAIAMNGYPLLSGPEWEKMLHWLPEDLWQRVHPSVGIQDDVNGFPRAAAIGLLQRGIHRIFTGINPDSGGPPFPAPAAFWWKMPDGRRLFVYQGEAYSSGYDYFESAAWRRGPLPPAGDTRYRPPRAGETFASDEASVRKAHRRLLQRIHALESRGYPYPVLLLTITNQWRMDNDPPFLPLADFVAAWNRLDLKPTLRLTTIGAAMKRLEDEIGSRVPEYQGEWTDWWINGAASAPREVAASRQAKRLLEAAQSPLWGDMNAAGRHVVDETLRELCLFDEHSWGSSKSIAFPYDLDSQGQAAEKACLAYRPMARAQWLLGQRVRSRLATEGEGLYLANTAPLAWSGWVRMPANALREEYRSLDDPRSGDKRKLYFDNGVRYAWPQNLGEFSREDTAGVYADNVPRQVAKFWAEGLPGQTVRKLRLSTQDTADDSPPATGPTVAVDAQGWPTTVTWPGMTRPLFLPGMGDFSAVRIKGPLPRWQAKRMLNANDAKRAKLRAESLEETAATAPDQCRVDDDPHTIVYTQAIAHPRLRWATRRLEVWKGEPRARFTLRINRISLEDPESFYLAFPLPCQSVMPETSCGGLPFVPFSDQLPGTCRDYFAIDGWVRYATPAGDWIWASRDAPLVAFGGPQTKARRKDPPQNMHRLMAMIFDNFWYEDFPGDSHGVMEFQFDLVWRKQSPDASGVVEVARTLLAEPQVLINPGMKEDPIVIKRLYEP